MKPLSDLGIKLCRKKYYLFINNIFFKMCYFHWLYNAWISARLNTLSYILTSSIHPLNDANFDEYVVNPSLVLFSVLANGKKILEVIPTYSPLT